MDELSQYSSYYPAGPASKSPHWWFDVPLKWLATHAQGTVHLTCSNRAGAPGAFLSVPGRFFTARAADLARAKRHGADVFRLHLSARAVELLADVLGTGHVSFAEFRVAPPVQRAGAGSSSP